MISKDIILGGGKGTRLLPLTSCAPKEMVMISDKPVIEHALEVLRAIGIHEVLFVVAPGKEQIGDYFGSGEHFGMRVEYRVQE